MFQFNFFIIVVVVVVAVGVVGRRLAGSRAFSMATRPPINRTAPHQQVGTPAYRPTGPPARLPTNQPADLAKWRRRAANLDASRPAAVDWRNQMARSSRGSDSGPTRTHTRTGQQARQVGRTRLGRLCTVAGALVSWPTLASDVFPINLARRSCVCVRAHTLQFCPPTFSTWPARPGDYGARGQDPGARCAPTTHDGHAETLHLMRQATRLTCKSPSAPPSASSHSLASS